MKRLSLITVISLLAAPALFAQKQGYADMVEQVLDAVAQIRVTQSQQTVSRSRGADPFEEFFNRRQRGDGMPRQGGGTGFVISKDGYVVTNRHVVKDADEIEVTIGDETYEARLIGVDNSMDIAVIKLDGQSNMRAVEIGDSAKMRIGDIVLAMGYPLDLGFSVTSGIVSGLGRNMRLENLDIGEYIQTDADITFGNSGGPLFNTRGEVIAINTMIVTRGETFGFSIPSNMFRRSVDQLIKFGEVRRGALGVTLGSLTDEQKEFYGVPYGAIIGSVTPGMPAEEAGIRQYDIVRSVNGKKTEDSNQLIQMVAGMLPGDKVTLEITRGTQNLTKSFELGDRAAFFEDSRPVQTRYEEPEVEENELGIAVTGLDRATRRQLGLSRGDGGVMVKSVEDGSPAAEKGLVEGAIITHVNNEPLRSADQLQKELEKVKPGKLIALDVAQASSRGLSDGGRIFVRKPK